MIKFELYKFNLMQDVNFEVRGGGMLNNNESCKLLTVYGFCPVYGRANHFLTKEIIKHNMLGFRELDTPTAIKC